LHKITPKVKTHHRSTRRSATCNKTGVIADRSFERRFRYHQKTHIAVYLTWRCLFLIHSFGANPRISLRTIYPQKLQTLCYIFIADSIGAGRILKVEGHRGSSKYFGAKRRKKFLVPPHFSVVPTQFLMELGAQPSKLNNSNCHF